MTAAPKKRLTLNDTESELKAKASKAVAADLVPQQFKMVHLNLVSESPTNPRKHFDAAKLAELAADIRVHGVMQPLLVRPIKGDKFELVFGHRRLRAAREAGLAEVPVLIAELGDQEVVERQLVENDQRDDLSPLDRARGYALLRDGHNLSVEAIAERTGRSVSSIRDTLRLGQLGTEGIKALEAGELTASTALLVARVPGSLQKKLLSDIKKHFEPSDEPISFRFLQEHIHDNFMKEVGHGISVFDVADSTLVPAAGSCLKCPKNTACDKKSFPDVKLSAKAEGMCTDLECHKAKEEAWAKQEREKGKKVLSRTEAEKQLNQYDDRPRYNSEYVLASEAKGVEKDKVVLAPAPGGGVVKLVAKVDVPAAEKSSKLAAAEKKQQLAEARRRAEADLRDDVDVKVRAAIVARFEKKISATDEKAFFRWLCQIALDNYIEDEVLERRNIGNEDVEAHLDKMTIEQLRGFLWEVNNYGSYGTDWTKHFKIDRKKFEAQVKAEAKAAEKTPPSGAAKKSGKKAA